MRGVCRFNDVGAPSVQGVPFYVFNIYLELKLTAI